MPSLNLLVDFVYELSKKFVVVILSTVLLLFIEIRLNRLTSSFLMNWVHMRLLQELLFASNLLVGVDYMYYLQLIPRNVGKCFLCAIVTLFWCEGCSVSMEKLVQCYTLMPGVTCKCCKIFNLCLTDDFLGISHYRDNRSNYSAHVQCFYSSVWTCMLPLYIFPSFSQLETTNKFSEFYQDSEKPKNCKIPQNIFW